MDYQYIVSRAKKSSTISLTSGGSSQSLRVSLVNPVASTPSSPCFTPINTHCFIPVTSTGHNLATPTSSRVSTPTIFTATTIPTTAGGEIQGMEKKDEEEGEERREVEDEREKPSETGIDDELEDGSGENEGEVHTFWQ